MNTPMLFIAVMLIFFSFLCEGTSAHLAQKIMVRVERYYLVGVVGLIPENVLPDLNQ